MWNRWLIWTRSSQSGIDGIIKENSQTLEPERLLQKTSQSQLTMENPQRVQESSQTGQQTTETTIALNISITFEMRRRRM